MLNTVRLLFFTAFLALLSCTDQDDNAFVADPGLEIQDFIWKGLNIYSFWQGDVVDLQDDRFASQQEYENFLSGYPDPETLFYDLLAPEDRFSYITNDYNELRDSFAGNFDSNGMEFGLLGYSDTDKVDGYVRYVYEGSDAWQKGIRRGDLFTGVNGISLNRQNYFELLFGVNSGQYILNMADYDNADNIVANGQNIELVKSPATLNPVFLLKTFDLSNGIKVGYLMYNRFTANFDKELNTAFAQLKADGVNELILDLRYNPGGSVSSATNLASMVTGQFTNDLFVKLTYNQKLQRFNRDYRFRSELGGGENINSLGLNRLFVITTSRTASASELIINGLDPYLEVMQVGDVTVGKNEASITLYDSPSFNYDDEGLNPNHRWAMQPIVARNENSVGFNDYTAGFTPDILLKENYKDLGVLGDQGEPLLQAALTAIDPSVATKTIPVSLPPGKELMGSEWQKELKDNMYIELLQ